LTSLIGAITRVIRTAKISEIDRELLMLGGGNHTDNMKVLGNFPNHYLVELSEDEFLRLIFLQSKEIYAICPPGQDRGLKAVAARAISSTQRKFSNNWDLDLISKRTEEFLQKSNKTFCPISLRDAHGSECKYGSWYLQDGSHRALGYAIALISGQATYEVVRAFCATQQHLAGVGIR
jgi:hypothetical protein